MDKKKNRMGLITRFRQASPLTKVAICWASSATICLTGYYFARLWAGDQKVESLKIKQILNDQFNERLDLARSKIEDEQKLAEATAATRK